MIKKIIQWGCKYLSSHGYTLKSNLPALVQNTPWSYVVRFATSDGYIYLKHTPELLALEANIIQILHDKLKVSVPKIIAHNVELNCFLMKDAGQPLRELLKKQFDTALFCKAIEQFTSMQLVVANHLNIFFDIGVPDWRLDKLPDLYMQLLLQKEVLIADGLTKQEISKLEKLLPRVSNLCQKLSDYAIKPSLVQPDFNDNNTLIADVSQEITMIDLGEIVISHPFFSLINCLQQAKNHHTLTDKDARYQQIIDACLKNYKVFATKKHLLEAFKIVGDLFFIYGALGNYRLRVACDTGRLSTSSFQRHGRPSIPLKEFLAITSR
ncbi:MAG: aminoglycoside phosphotransferase family protein [Legionella sp.]|nr:aminoglycoside phosphotransferase family protein [Legionella sp.]